MGWCLPTGSVVKLNFDATFNESREKSVSEVVVRNVLGEVLAFKTVVHREVASWFAVDAIVCLQAVFVGKQKGFTSVVIEGDSVS
ncbi:hypothetical protein Golob_001099, partial [Gossypium lobatum]|nr:hypothetical protein [Gossypium lobatum]